MNAKEVNPFDRIPPYLVVQDFLGNDLIERLLEHAKCHEADFEPTKVGNTDGRLDPEIRVSKVLRDFGDLQVELEAKFNEAMPKAISELRLSLFNLARCEIELVAHNDGAFYQRHIDTQTGIHDEKTQRVLTGVLYLHSLPKGFSGGQFRLHAFSSPEAGENFVDIEPERDRLVLFPAWAPHEVRPVCCPSGEFDHSRFAINCWYRRPNPQ